MSSSKEERISLIHSDDSVSYGYDQSDAKVKSRNRTLCRCVTVLVFIAIALTVALVAVLLVTLKPWVQPEKRSPSTLPQSITTQQIMDHLQALQKLSGSNGSRSVATGYNESAEYVYQTLVETGGFNVTRQYFNVLIFEDLIPGQSVLNATFGDTGYAVNFLQDVEFSVMGYSGSGAVTGNLSFPEGDGCSSGNYDKVNKTIALIDYYSGNCSFADKAYHAKDAGALAVILMRDEEHAALSPSRSRVRKNDKEIEIPVLGATYALGQELIGASNLTDNLVINIVTKTKTSTYTTYNVLAYSLTGNTSAIIVMGSHLDSVPAGPGINDNGSGSSVNLQLAILLAELIKNGDIKVKNQVLFAFWGAEEIGLLGSDYFVSELVKDNMTSNYAVNLNYDMVASPNFIRGIYNGSGAGSKIRTQCETITKLYEDYFEENAWSYELEEFTGRSDYGPFIASGVNIPAGGLFTGAEGLKSEEERKKYGGFANAQYDPCYHLACDTIDNINQAALGQMAGAAATILQNLVEREDLKQYLLKAP